MPAIPKSTEQAFTVILADVFGNLDTDTLTAPTVNLCKDGVWAPATNAPTCTKAGYWRVVLTAAETNCRELILEATKAGMVTRTEVFYPEPDYTPQKAVSLPTAAPGTSGGMPTTDGAKLNQTVDLTPGQQIEASNMVAAPDNAGIQAAKNAAEAVQGVTDELATMMEDSGGQRFTAKALEEAPGVVLTATEREQLTAMLERLGGSLPVPPLGTPMTPWAYTDDLSVQFNVARALLGENDPETARLTDANVTSTLATFGFQAGMVVLAQQVLVSIDNEVIRSQEQGGASYQWSEKRRDSLLAIIQKGNAGQLPDPETGATVTAAPGSITLANAPQW